MKAITLTQPWASLVAKGAKKIETRSWNTTYRGPLAIHAAKGFPSWARQQCYSKYFLPALFDDYDGRWQSLPVGAIVATCELVRVQQIFYDTKTPDYPELAFGDYSQDRYMWYLDNIVAFQKPIPAKGALSLWEWNNGGLFKFGMRIVVDRMTNTLFELQNGKQIWYTEMNSTQRSHADKLLAEQHTS